MSSVVQRVAALFNLWKRIPGDKPRDRFDLSLSSGPTTRPLSTTSGSSSGAQPEASNKPEPGSSESRSWIFGQVLDPRSRYIRAWNRLFLVSRGLSLAIDPLFLYVVSIDEDSTCLHVDGWFAALVTILRAAIDVMLLWHVRLQLKLAFVSKKSLVVGRGKLVWDGKKVALHYIQQREGFLCDVLVMLPIMEVLIWLIVPGMITKRNQGIHMMSLVLFVFILQYLPKVSHLVLLMRRMQHVTGYIFSSAWWGFVLNLTAYFIASHVAGACWYLLGLQRIETCMHVQLEKKGFRSSWLGCHKPISFGHAPVKGSTTSPLSINSAAFISCISNYTNTFSYGIYQPTIPLALTRNWLERISYPIFWGLMTLSSFGNLEPTNHVPEVAFSIIVITCGLLLFTLLIGNIQMFLYSMTSKKEEMQLKMRDLEHWMKRRQLPTRLRHRVRHYERQKWASTRGVDEHAMVCDLPDGIKRDIKRHLCLDLVRQVPLFGQMDEVVLDNICDRVKPILYIKDEIIMREGDPVLRMLFMVRGQLESVYRVGKSKMSIVTLGPGNFCGEELLPWCLYRSSDTIASLPPSIATISCLESVEAFGLEAEDLKYVTQNFQHTFINEKLRHTTRYYSPGWRTWAAVNIQLAWRRYKYHKALALDMPRQGGFVRKASEASLRKDLLRMYAAMMVSPKPRDATALQRV
ncbi:cyclic nucleotide-gated ion channel 2 isoform X1 [Selaginella moellendorffii]|uniref:cyclic nucleotide-gated ion channel 2 isoform X1 n=2 Tax=Selaginella moellendorffii TaxID=88036 RepID=UPI000D1CB42C|nr:cyclic nucleotide-gated ion channel 2 isoform X1 [Selaginella moellendorffii]|eukprot:XP_024526116.1 cyclic nucleotide-gated ion channel 2 isoform X1 [Selaginella moellendorffii]